MQAVEFEKALKSSLMNRRMHPGMERVITVAIMAVLIATVMLFNIPNPNMILIAGLVVSSALFGYNGGIIAGVIMFMYTLYFFSTDHDFVTFTAVNFQKVVVSLVGILADMLFVCNLKRNEIRAYMEIQKLTAELREDNTKLQEASCIDALTGIRNRYALRNDYASYLHREVYVMMLDIDNFKLVNDTYGHDVGDTVLAETGGQLANFFGRDFCYRYGGDEFLVIVPDVEEADFFRRLERLQEKRPLVNQYDPASAVSYSIGYTHGMLQERDRLREMFAVADEHMYDAKHQGKNTVSGD